MGISEPTESLWLRYGRETVPLLPSEWAFLDEKFIVIKILCKIILWKKWIPFKLFSSFFTTCWWYPSVILSHKLHYEPQISEIGGRESGTELWLLSPENTLGRNEHKAVKICLAVERTRKKEKEGGKERREGRGRKRKLVESAVLTESVEILFYSFKFC